MDGIGKYIMLLYISSNFVLFVLKALSDGVNQLAEVLTTLENSIMDVKKDCESKKRVSCSVFAWKQVLTKHIVIYLAHRLSWETA